MDNQAFETIVEPKNKLFDLNLKELWKYKDLTLLFVKRNFISQYKQTVLGPAWAVIQPLLTTVIFTLIFGNIAGLAPGGVNSFVYYLCGTVFWQYFASCLTMVSHTFTGNAGIFGKVYFPRMVLPVSTVLTNLISLSIQFAFFLVAWVIFLFIPGYEMHPGWEIVLLPLLLVEMALLALGCGIIISALTTKYRDLAMLVSFGVHLWMYATPVTYSTSMIADKYPQLLGWYMLNPITPIIELFRAAYLGVPRYSYGYNLLSVIVTVVVFLLGVILFSRTEKTFMDTV